MCKISLEHKSTSHIKPIHHTIHSKPSESTKPAFTPKYEYVEVAKLVINPDTFINHNCNSNSNSGITTPEVSLSSQTPSPVTTVVSKYRSNIQNAIEFSQFGNKQQHTSRIIITEPMLEGELIIPIVVRRVVVMASSSESNGGFDGEPHYLTTYSKNNDPLLLDKRYETTPQRLPPIKCKTTYDILRNTFLNKMMTRFTGLNATRRAYQNVDFSGKGIISKNDLKTALIALGIYSITDDDFNLLYLELAGQPNKMIMYPGFKNYIEKHM